jgi:hypothetical protein
MNRLGLISLWFLLCSPALFADTLPFYAQWRSLNTMYYDGSQTGKELSWDELYHAEFGFRGLQHKAVQLDLALETEQFFDRSRIMLKTIEISGRINPLWAIAAGSREHGFAKGFMMDEQPALMRGYQSYNFQQMRLNALRISHIPSSSSSMFSLEIGGNIHNQAVAMFSWHQWSESIELNASQELRTMDSHWRTPVAISGVDLSFASQVNKLRTVAALSLLPEVDSTVAHHELFTQAELEHSIFPTTNLALAAMLKMQDYAPRQTERYQVRLSQDLSEAISLSPIIELNIIDGSRFWWQRILINYQALPACDVGIYYDYSHFQTTEGRHSVGLALAFGVDLARPHTRL